MIDLRLTVWDLLYSCMLGEVISILAYLGSFFLYSEVKY